MGSEDVTATSGGGAEPRSRFNTSRSGDRFAPGDTISDRYRVVSKLGKGGMGEVFRADDLVLGQSVALKFLPAEVSLDPVRLERLRGEVRLTRQVSHPNVCRVYDIGEADGQHFLAMEYIDGEDLSVLIRRIGRLPGEKAVEIARQICAGLAAAHDQGVIHRDLKPANIMIDGRGKARITDFGVAAFGEDLDEGEPKFAGTPAYMAPEQFQGRDISRQSDLYSLGLVLYELFTGKPAYNASSIAEIREIHSSSAPPTSPSSIVTDIDPAAERVILRCLEQEPAHRPQSAMAVMAALPGGDPLKAMLEAGETPSPELVAASGRSGALSKRTGLLIFLVGMITASISFIAGGLDPLHELTGGLQPPDVMEFRAREMIKALGYDEEPAATARAYLTWRLPDDNWVPEDELRARYLDDTSGRITFGYRQHTRHFVPVRSTMPGGRLGEVVTMTDPPMTEPGMVSAQLSTDARLLWFKAVTERLTLPDPDGTPATPVDWDQLLATAGFEGFEFSEIEPAYEHRTGWDEKRAWEGSHPGEAWKPIRIEAAALAGRLTSFVVSQADDPARTLPNGDNELRDRAQGGVMSLIGLIGGGILAVRNLRLGRGDRRGAVRLGVFFFVMSMLGWLIGTDHAPDVGTEARLFISGTAYALIRTAIACILYVGLEPYIRKVFPTSLIGWSRLLAGRWRDPIVGRDVLIAVASFGIFGGVSSIIMLLTDRRDLIDTLPQPNVIMQFSIYLRNPVVSVGFALVFMMFVIGLITVCRRPRWLAPAMIVLLMTVFTNLGQLNNLQYFDFMQLAQGIANGLIFAFLVYRVGLLSLLLLFILGSMMEFPISFDPDMWYSVITYTVIAVIGGLGVFGFVVSTAGQSWGGEVRDER